MFNSSKKISGFTLVEVLVSVFIFALVFSLLITLIGMASGRTVSKAKNITIDMRNVMDTISQKMNNANEVHNISGNIYGFGIRNNMLVIVSKNTAGGKTCTFIGRKQTSPPPNEHNVLAMSQSDNCTTIPSTTNDLSQVMHPAYINILSFDITSDNFIMTSAANPGKSPYIKMLIEARDTKEDFNLKFQNTYILDYQTVKKFMP